MVGLLLLLGCGMQVRKEWGYLVLHPDNPKKAHKKDEHIISYHTRTFSVSENKGGVYVFNVQVWSAVCTQVVQPDLDERSIFTLLHPDLFCAAKERGWFVLGAKSKSC